MQLTEIKIQHYRSIEDITLFFPENKPIILFGSNNAGKSNILSAINRILGERYPTYIEMLDSDYFMRDKKTYPSSTIIATFSEPLYHDKQNNGIDRVAVTYGSENNPNCNSLHDGNDKKIFPTNEQRANFQSYLINAERNIQNALNYSSKYTILSKFSHKIHETLSLNHKKDLSDAFYKIKKSFEETREFADFFETFTDSLYGSVKGFVHSLAVDFSAYDPNNYAKSLRIYAKEGEVVRGFEEFGTGEQQVLLMAFIKAYMQVFSSKKFILIIEEPEAHLHPLAQKWLKEYIFDMCKSGIQVMISTHSVEFLNAEYLDGLIRVYKENDTTKIIQLDSRTLTSFCILTGVPKNKISEKNILDFYVTKLFDDQLKGLFAETILLVEGATEYFSIPIYLKKLAFSLPEHGIEIINCRGKESIALFWRLFSAYNYKCYFIFDRDDKEKNKKDNNEIFKDIIYVNKWKVQGQEYVVEKNYAYFGKDFESYFSSSINEYSKLKEEIKQNYNMTSTQNKPGMAKAIAQHCAEVPKFIIELKIALENLSKS